MNPADEDPAVEAEAFDLASQRLEEAAAKAAALFVSIYRGLEQRPVAPPTSRAALRAAIAGTVGEAGVGLVPALEDFERWVLPGSMGTPHPLYLGLVNSSPLPAAALADLLISSLNNNGGAFHQSPAMSTCEEELVREFARLFGMAGADGMLLPGGTFATLQAIVLARVRATGGPARPGLRLYTSESAHFSVARAAIVAGIAAEDVVTIPVTGRGAMDADALERRIRRDREEGAAPFAVVATAGTTATGALDPLADIAAVSGEAGTWLHVDACYGGGAILLEPMRARFAGIERADSIAIDPHKWFFIPVTAALLLTIHRDVAQRTFATTAGSYIPTDGEPDAWQRGIPTTRRSSGLAVWLALRAHGWRTIRGAVKSNIDLTRLLEGLLAERGFRVLEGGELSIACARWEPRDLSAEAIDGLQDAITREVVSSGKAWFSTTRHAGRTWLRFNMVNLYTREHHVRRLADLLAATASGRATATP
ncbi:MAG TPA: pyridoxal-dependent decarboxylase [Vicinamibacteria bacterium]|nr:pyridoxal-dependent decarboxylase [Vicinamibacteria bacterium]